MHDGPTDGPQWHASNKLSISIHFLMIKAAFSVVLFVQIPQKYKWNFDRVQQKNTLEERFFGQWQYLLKRKTPLLEFFFNVWRVYTSFLKTMKRYRRPHLKKGLFNPIPSVSLVLKELTGFLTNEVLLASCFDQPETRKALTRKEPATRRRHDWKLARGREVLLKNWQTRSIVKK